MGILAKIEWALCLTQRVNPNPLAQRRTPLKDRADIGRAAETWVKRSIPCPLEVQKWARKIGLS